MAKYWMKIFIFFCILGHFGNNPYTPPGIAGCRLTLYQPNFAYFYRRCFV